MQYSARTKIAQFLLEDIGKQDITSLLLAKKRTTAQIISRKPGIIAGVRFAQTAFNLRGCTSTASMRDGQQIRAGTQIMQIRGTVQGVLSVERTALNLLSRMSGIATQTHKLVNAISKTNVKLYATRKTAPGFAFFDKKAVKIGGGASYRMTLDEKVLIKDNHIAVARSSSITLETLVKRALKKHRVIEVEVETIQDAILAAKAGAKIIMLDNFTPRKIRRAINTLERNDLRKKIKLEASGGINATNIHTYASTGVDIISVGEITLSVNAIDMSLEILS